MGNLIIQVLAYNISHEATTYKTAVKIVTHVGTLEAKLAHAVHSMVDIANRVLHAKIKIDNIKATEFAIPNTMSEEIFKNPLILVLALPVFFDKCFDKFKEHIHDGLDSVELLDATAYALQGFANEVGEITHDVLKKAMIVSEVYLGGILKELEEDLHHVSLEIPTGLHDYKANVNLLVSTFNTIFVREMDSIHRT